MAINPLNQIITEPNINGIIGGIALAMLLATLKPLAKKLTKRKKPEQKPIEAYQVPANKKIGIQDPLHGMFAKADTRSKEKK